MIKDYVKYLYDLVGRSEEYSNLLEILSETEFYSLVPNDDNREEDGKQLRSIFQDEMAPHGVFSLPDGPCSVLEMLIGMAKRLEWELCQSRWERTFAEWFWVLIDNLGLEWCDNYAWERLEKRSEVENKVKTMVERTYLANGQGGLFPLKCATFDERKRELWYQMSDWVLENYPIC